MTLKVLDLADARRALADGRWAAPSAGGDRPPGSRLHRQAPDRRRRGGHRRRDRAAPRVARAGARVDRRTSPRSSSSARPRSASSASGPRAGAWAARGRRRPWRRPPTSRSTTRSRSTPSSGSTPTPRTSGAPSRTCCSWPAGSIARRPRPSPTAGEEPAMKVRELMTGAPITVGPETPVFEARQTMLKERIRHLLVIEGTPAGRHRHRPRHPPQPAVAGHEPLGVGGQLPAGQAHGGRGHDQERDHHRARPGRRRRRAPHARAQDRRAARCSTASTSSASSPRRTSCAPSREARAARAPGADVNRILVVEDEPDLAVTYDRLLRREGYRVVTAASRGEGLKAIESAPPALVIADLRLPGRRRARHHPGGAGAATRRSPSSSSPRSPRGPPGMRPWPRAPRPFSPNPFPRPRCCGSFTTSSSAPPTEAGRRKPPCHPTP